MKSSPLRAAIQKVGKSSFNILKGKIKLSCAKNVQSETFSSTHQESFLPRRAFYIKITSNKY
jgi:hypothetical protein